MLRVLFCILLMGTLSLSAVADTVGQGGSMEQEFEKTAREFAGLPIERMAQSDTAYPKDLAEFEAMDGFGMMFVAAISQDKTELPPKRVYALVGGKQVELRLILGSFATSSGSPQVQKTIGHYRWNGLYCYPVYLSAEAKQLFVDFAKGRDGFSLGVPSGLPAYLKGRVPHPVGIEPPTEAAMAFLRREYPGMFAQADQH